MIIFSEIRALIDRGALMQASEILSIELEQAPNDIQALKLRAEIGFRRGDREAGFADAMRAVTLDPADASYGLDCAYYLLRSGRRDDALAIANLVAAGEPELVDYRDALGTVFTHCERPEIALRHFEYACARAPERALLWHNLASVQRMLGDNAAAESSLDAAIRLDEKDGKSYLSRSQLRRQSLARNHVEDIKRALGDARDAKERIFLGYALAKEQEDLGRFAEAFQALSSASEEHRRRLAYDPLQELEMLRSLGGLQYPHPEARAGEGVTDGPIFVLGLPRSGTTLVERIIASTNKVRSAGEPNTLAAEIWRIAARHGRPANREDAIVKTVEQHGAAVGQAYARLLSARFANARYIDKTPGNYLYAGLIRSHVPGARIICLRRSPMDTCYAMYKMLFFGAYDFSYRLEELADYYAEWDALIRHWEATLGDCWLTVEYEKLIENPEITMRRIIAHCGLEWDANCLKFHDLAAPVTSASAGQVSVPLNNRSIGLWRRYSEQLSELATRLRHHGIDPDDDAAGVAN